MKCNYIEYHRLTDQMFSGVAQTDKWWCSKHNVETWYWNTSHN